MELTCFPFGRRCSTATTAMAAAPVASSTDDDDARCCCCCCYCCYCCCCCCYACALCSRCCRLAIPARSYPPERSTTEAFSWESSWRPVLGASFPPPRLSLRKTGLLRSFRFEGVNPQTLTRRARTNRPDSTDTRTKTTIIERERALSALHAPPRLFFPAPSLSRFLFSIPSTESIHTVHQTRTPICPGDVNLLGVTIVDTRRDSGGV